MTLDPWDGFFLCFGKICAVVLCAADLFAAFVVLEMARRRSSGGPVDEDDDPDDEIGAAP